MAVFSNQANLSYNGGNTNSNIVTGEIIDVVSVTKTAVTTEYSPGDTVTYVVSILNSGNIPYSGLTVTDNLGEYALEAGTAVPLTYVDGSVKYYQNGVLQPNPAVSTAPVLTFSEIGVPANGNTTVIYSATANESAPPAAGSSIVNTVTVTGNGISVPATDTAEITVETEPVLTISKAVNPAVVTENSPLTYTFTIQNTGNRAAEATDNLVITDNFDPVLEDITVTINGDAAVEGTEYNYDSTTGVFTTIPGVVTVPSAQYTVNDSGEWTVTPGTTVVTVSGIV